jgi:hypothetical protein
MPDFSGAVVLTLPDTEERHVRKQLTKLLRVGGRLAVLGVEDGLRSMGRWHVARPGTWSVPQGLSGRSDQEGNDLTYARALCGRRVVTNGYAADWRPPDGQLCPGCREQL